MANVADLTKTELSDAISDTTVKAWFDSSDAYDASFTTAELLVKLLQAAYRAQVIKNEAANDATPLVAGEALAAYNAPVTSTVSFDTETGVQAFTQSLTVSAISSVDSNLTIPVRA